MINNHMSSHTSHFTAVIPDVTPAWQVPASDELDISANKAPLHPQLLASRRPLKTSTIQVQQPSKDHPDIQVGVQVTVLSVNANDRTCVLRWKDQQQEYTYTFEEVMSWEYSCPLLKEPRGEHWSTTPVDMRQRKFEKQPVRTPIQYFKDLLESGFDLGNMTEGEVYAPGFLDPLLGVGQAEAGGQSGVMFVVFQLWLFEAIASTTHSEKELLIRRMHRSFLSITHPLSTRSKKG
jgi:hypothetical protein